MGCIDIKLIPFSRAYLTASFTGDFSDDSSMTIALFRYLLFHEVPCLVVSIGVASMITCAFAIEVLRSLSNVQSGFMSTGSFVS